MEKIKKSVLKTFLFVCLGLFITTIAVADSYDPPGPPGRPNVAKLYATSCVLTYSAPLDDGGSPVLGYYIEYKYVGESDWNKVNRIAHSELTFSPNSITEGKEIQFRVTAVNNAGEGPPSKPSDPVRPSPQYW